MDEENVLEPKIEGLSLEEYRKGARELYHPNNGQRYVKSDTKLVDYLINSVLTGNVDVTTSNFLWHLCFRCSNCMVLENRDFQSNNKCTNTCFLMQFGLIPVSDKQRKDIEEFKRQCEEESQRELENEKKVENMTPSEKLDYIMGKDKEPEVPSGETVEELEQSGYSAAHIARIMRFGKNSALPKYHMRLDWTEEERANRLGLLLYALLKFPNELLVNQKQVMEILNKIEEEKRNEMQLLEEKKQLAKGFKRKIDKRRERFLNERLPVYKEWLKNPKGRTKADLARQLHISPTQVGRDLKLLEQFEQKEDTPHASDKG